MPQNPTQRRAADTVAAWLAKRGKNNAWLVTETGADPGTIGDFLNGLRWPKLGTQGKIEAALGWPAGIIRQIGNGGEVPAALLADPSEGEDEHVPDDLARAIGAVIDQYRDQHPDVHFQERFDFQYGDTVVEAKTPDPADAYYTPAQIVRYMTQLLRESGSPEEALLLNMERFLAEEVDVDMWNEANERLGHRVAARRGQSTGRAARHDQDRAAEESQDPDQEMR